MSNLIHKFFGREQIYVIIPESLKTDVSGFKFLTNLYDLITSNKVYALDFKGCIWIEANLCAILGAVVGYGRNLGSTFELKNISKNPYIHNTLYNNGFLSFVENGVFITGNRSGIPFAMYDMKDEHQFENYIYKYVLSNRSIPKMSEGAKKKIFRSIFELYQNSVMHSEAACIYVCGQYYLRKGRMALTMAEFGKTFKNNVTDFSADYKFYTGSQCIEWAVQSGNTTKDINDAGGLGLDLIRDFLIRNEGKLQINSAEGYWEEKKGTIFVQDCDYSFPGSIVNIEFNLYDKNEYFTREEINISDIL